MRYSSEHFDGLHRDRFVQALRAEGVPCDAGYGVPLYKQPAFKRESIARWLCESSKPWPDYENMHLPASERFCAEEQITLPHQVLLADRSGIQGILDAVIKVKQNGPAACHTGNRSCFYVKWEDDQWVEHSNPLFDPAEVYKKK